MFDGADLGLALTSEETFLRVLYLRKDIPLGLRRRGKEFGVPI